MYRLSSFFERQVVRKMSRYAQVKERNYPPIQPIVGSQGIGGVLKTEVVQKKTTPLSGRFGNLKVKIVYISHKPAYKDGKGNHLPMTTVLFKVLEGEEKDKVLFENFYYRTPAKMVDLIRACQLIDNETGEKIQLSKFGDPIVLNQKELFISTYTTTYAGEQQTYVNKMSSEPLMSVFSEIVREPYPVFSSEESEKSVSQASDTQEKLKTCLQEVFGYTTFQAYQERIIHLMLQGKDILAILPTGAGKSLCYQLPAMLQPGLCIVVSPLIALMVDQVGYLRERGIPAAYLNSALSNQTDVVSKLAAYKFLYVSPEKFLSPKFISQLSSVKVVSIVIDEAHCISQWGHSFRPDYRRLSSIKEQFKDVPIAAFTATATRPVSSDIAIQLNLEKASCVIGSFDRPNLIIRCHERVNLRGQLSAILEDHQGESGIIYAPTKKKVDEIYEWLKENKEEVVRYHSGLSNTQRLLAHDAFATDKAPLIVATIAFGMGINKSNVRFVVHTGMPQSLEQYYQEIGRAGRDGDAAACLCLYSKQDKVIQRRFAYREEDLAVRQNLFRKVDQIDAFCQSAQCRRVELLDYFGEQYLKSNCGSCDNCIEDAAVGVDGSVIAKEIMACVRSVQETASVWQMIYILKGSATEGMLKRDYHTVDSYGVLKMYPEAEIRYFIYTLINQGYLIETGADFPVIKLTLKAHTVAFQKQAIYFKKDVIRDPHRIE